MAMSTVEPTPRENRGRVGRLRMSFLRPKGFVHPPLPQKYALEPLPQMSKNTLPFHSFQFPSGLGFVGSDLKVVTWNWFCLSLGFTVHGTLIFTGGSANN